MQQIIGKKKILGWTNPIAGLKPVVSFRRFDCLASHVFCGNRV